MGGKQITVFFNEQLIQRICFKFAAVALLLPSQSTSAWHTSLPSFSFTALAVVNLSFTRSSPMAAPCQTQRESKFYFTLFVCNLMMK